MQDPTFLGHKFGEDGNLLSSVSLGVRVAMGSGHPCVHLQSQLGWELLATHPLPVTYHPEAWGQRPPRLSAWSALGMYSTWDCPRRESNFCDAVWLAGAMTSGPFSMSVNTIDRYFLDMFPTE